MDLDWERSLPRINAEDALVRDIFHGFSARIGVRRYSALNVGCRCSNYAVETDQGKYLLRLSPSNELNNETVAFRALGGIIAMPGLLYHKQKDGLNIFIYEYIDGELLQRNIVKRNRCDAALLRQVARASALIHNTERANIAGIQEFETPPYEAWYEFFLENRFVKDRLGDDLYARIRRLLARHKAEISEIDRHHSVIHSDFRPANMIVSVQNKVYIIDWEYMCFGHSLADIGQFFRYRQYFNEADFREFEKVYNELANHALPDGWQELSTIRDLVNPLQMLSTAEEQPVKNADLLGIICATVESFGF